MNRKLFALAVLAAFVTMGISMPSCPGQQAVQKQVDELQAKSADGTKRIQSLESQIRVLNTEMGQVKTLLSQVSNTVLSQEKAIKQLEESLKSASKPAPKSKAPAKGAHTTKKRR